MNNSKSFEILDCTIRDGGYLNNWHFDNKLVRELYRNISRSGVDLIEIGLRNQPKDGVGVWYYTPEEVLNEIFEGISGVGLSLLIDDGRADLENIPDAQESLVRLYRIASHKNRVSEGIQLCEKIKERGYQTSLQLMGIVGYGKEELQSVISPLKDSTVDYVYFADSYGSLFPSHIPPLVDALQKSGKKIGFHPHNNLQLAFANTLEAMRCGIDIVDGTVYGMGRGAGNLPLEVLLIYLEKTLGQDRYNSLPVLDLIDRYILKLHKELRWGYNLPFMLSGAFEVHPDYSRTLTEHYHFTVDQIAKALEVIHALNPIGFKKELLERVVQSGFVMTDAKSSTLETPASLVKRSLTKPTYIDRHKGKDFLIIASGPSIKQYKPEIDQFIKRYDPVTIGVNYLGQLFVPHYHGFSNKKRFISYVDLVAENSKLLLSNIFEPAFISDYTQRGYEVMEHLAHVGDSFEIEDGVIKANFRTVGLLMVAVSIVMGAKRIFIAGMDGYDKEAFLANKVHFYEENENSKDFQDLMELHNGNEAMLRAINNYLLHRSREGLHIITPTSHKHFYNSIFNW